MDNNELAMAALSSLNNSLANTANVVMASNTSSQDRAFSREMSQLAWERNLEAWNMQNEYNLPVNQYRRQLEGLQMNGLNPNLVYGNSSAVSGAGGSISPYRFEGYHSTAVPRFGMVNSYQDLLNTRYLQTQVAAQEAQNRLINARADNEEARNPGIVAKSGEAAYRWNYIKGDILESYDAAIRANVARDYWKSVETEYNANSAKFKSEQQYYEAAMAEWLNTTKVPGTDLTYRQYFEQYRSMLPKEQYEKLKAETLDIGASMALKNKQGELIDLKKEYQGYVNKFAKLGRTLGNSWVNILLSGLMALFGEDSESGLLDRMKRAALSDPKTPEERGASEPGDW